MKRILMGFILLLLTTHCSTNEISGQQEPSDSLITNKPQTKIIVNKEYDENGNLVSFDSSYSYFYSNFQQDSLFGDTTLSLFQDKFFNSFPNIQRPFFDEMFFEDSLMNYDFFKDDFFSQRFRLNRSKFDKLFEEMDSIKNNFYKNYFSPQNQNK